MLPLMDPLALLPYALAAGGGRVGPYATAQLVTAGLTLLQRSAPLVRALSRGRSGLLLDNGPAWVVALAASEGRGAVILDPDTDRDTMVTQITTHRIGAVFTTAARAIQLPHDCPRVVLDEAPVRARIVVGDRDVTVDLGTHFGLDLVGDSTVEGADDECVVYATNGEQLTHRALLTQGRGAMERHRFTPVDRTLVRGSIAQPGVLTCGLLAPLLAGGLLHLVLPTSLTSAAADVAGLQLTKVVDHSGALVDLSRHD